MTTTVNDIEHIESQSLYGVGVIRVYFQPGREDRSRGIAQVTAIAQTMLRRMPPGTTPPLHPAVQRLERADPAARRCSSDTLTRAARSTTRQQLHPHAAGDVQGARAAAVSAASSGRCMVDLDPEALYAQRPLAAAT